MFSFDLHLCLTTLIWSMLVCVQVSPSYPNTFFDHSSSPLILSDKYLERLRYATKADDLRVIFDRINIYRPIGSAGHTQVREYITNFLRNLGWTIELDSFHSLTPHGNKSFRNIVATLEPEQPKYLVLACHYESKILDNFLGSTDSAMPCAIILKIVQSLTPVLRNRRRGREAVMFDSLFQLDTVHQNNFMNLGLKLVFFDGEEAFVSWSDTDSLYGSRHLAAKWDLPDAEGTRELDNIELLVLLDLIGASNPTFPYYKFRSDQFYGTLASIERAMSQNKLLRANKNGLHRYFGHSTSGTIMDDHVPFWQKNVSILHLIPLPFPDTWHTPADNAANIDWDTSMDILNLLEAFFRSSLHLE